MHRRSTAGFVGGIALCAGACAAGGCLSRPVSDRAPVLGTTFVTAVESRAVDKIDILFDIDNSASMGDKQDYLKAAIPDLVNRFVNPDCVDAGGAAAGPSDGGTCPDGQRVEFAPVHDLHLGIISSSLGKRGGDVCGPGDMADKPYANLLRHNDDGAHLLRRALTYNDGGASEGTVADAPLSDPYLYWFPSDANAGKTAGPGAPLADAKELVSDFADMVGGTGVFGCGIESQLESWYRFLVQPDPYDQIAPDSGTWVGVDSTLLQERHDFLRPDSLVLVVVLSDENDSEIDVRSVGGQAYTWMKEGFPPYRGTSACSNPASPQCQSCAATGAQNDPACVAGARYSQANDWGMDINLRHVHMKAKYGVDPQYPIDRYVTGLTSTTVPDRTGEYPAGAQFYVGSTDCQNPLFAASLPDGTATDVDSLCHAPPGSRSKDLVFYAHIGGVPSQLLHFKAGDADASKLGADDWVKILGSDPEHYDYGGIDPHMIESYEPRPGLAAPGSANGADPISGHEWITNTSNGAPGNQSGGHIMAVDREYACTFPLVDSSGMPSARDCANAANQSFCDCPLTAGSVRAEELPPICDPIKQTVQTGAKAYPTVRELTVAKKMGAQGIVSSICPIHVADNATHDDPYYGYRPAVAAIVDRLKSALSDSCLPEKLTVDPDGTVPCLVLLQIPAGKAGASGSCLDPMCPAEAGLELPHDDVRTKFCADLEAAYGQAVAQGGVGLTDPATVPVCQLRQLTPAAFPDDFPGGSCGTETADKGWCYVTGGDGGACPQSIVFAGGSLPSGATAKLQCDEQSATAL